MEVRGAGSGNWGGMACNCARRGYGDRRGRVCAGCAGTRIKMIERNKDRGWG